MNVRHMNTKASRHCFPKFSKVYTSTRSTQHTACTGELHEVFRIVVLDSLSFFDGFIDMHMNTKASRHCSPEFSRVYTPTRSTQHTAYTALTVDKHTTIRTNSSV
jgi:hypothetical protein